MWINLQWLMLIVSVYVGAPTVDQALGEALPSPRIQPDDKEDSAMPEKVFKGMLAGLKAPFGAQEGGVVHLHRLGMTLTAGGQFWPDSDYKVILDPRRLGIRDTIAVLLHNRGLAWLHRDELDKAMADFTRAVELDPAYIDAYVERGYVWKSKDHFVNALADYDQAIDLEYDPAYSYYCRGRAQQALGEHEQTLADFNEAIKLSAEDSEAYRERGESFLKLKKYDQAREDLEKAKSLGAEADAGLFKKLKKDGR
jgi:tetratricopeptide (TPR) repeat protein